jgi:hypothetical protein
MPLMLANVAVPVLFPQPILMIAALLLVVPVETRYIAGLVHPSAASPVIAATERVVVMFLSIRKPPNVES